MSGVRIPVCVFKGLYSMLLEEQTLDYLCLNFLVCEWLKDKGILQVIVLADDGDGSLVLLELMC